MKRKKALETVSKIMLAGGAKVTPGNSVAAAALKNTKSKNSQDKMTDLEKVETAIRSVLAHISIQPHETGVEMVLKLLADELEKIRITHGR